MSEIKYQMKTNIPSRKITAGGLGGAITTLIVWILNTFVLAQEQQISGEAAAAFTTIITFILGYFVSPGEQDGLIEKSIG
jgi:lipopolysaccharide export LptBFGC system permease protein LptF